MHVETLKLCNSEKNRQHFRQNLKQLAFFFAFWSQISQHANICKVGQKSHKSAYDMRTMMSYEAGGTRLDHPAGDANGVLRYVQYSKSELEDDLISFESAKAIAKKNTCYADGKS